MIYTQSKTSTQGRKIAFLYGYFAFEKRLMVSTISLHSQFEFRNSQNFISELRGILVLSMRIWSSFHEWKESRIRILFLHLLNLDAFGNSPVDDFVPTVYGDMIIPKTSGT